MKRRQLQRQHNTVQKQIHAIYQLLRQQYQLNTTIVLLSYWLHVLEVGVSVASLQLRCLLLALYVVWRHRREPESVWICASIATHDIYTMGKIDSVREKLSTTLLTTSRKSSRVMGSKMVQTFRATISLSQCRSTNKTGLIAILGTGTMFTGVLSFLDHTS